MRRGREWDNVHVGDSGSASLELVLDLVLLLVELALAKQVVDSLVVLREEGSTESRQEGETMRERTYDLEELALHLVLPTFGLELARNTEDLLDCTGDHTRRRFSLVLCQQSRIYAGMRERNNILGHPPS